MADLYSTGTVSVPSGGTTVTLTGGLFSGVLAGDTIEIGELPAKTIASPTDASHLELAVAVTSDQVDVPYVLRFDAPSRFTSGYLAEQVRALIAQAGIIKAARPNYEVQSLGGNAPPGSPVTGDMYVVGTAPTGAWAGRANNLAQWTGSAWLFTAPDRGTTVVSVATGIVSIWGGAAWLPYIGPGAFMQTLMPAATQAAAQTTLGLDRAARTLWTADISTPVAAINVPLAAAYRAFKLTIGCLTGSDATANLIHRISRDGSTVDTGASDYQGSALVVVGSGVSAAARTASDAFLGTLTATMVAMDITPGAAGLPYMCTSQSMEFASGYRLDFRGTRAANVGRAQFIQIYPSAGNLTAGTLTLAGYP
jgi:hypothetical protein